MDHLSLLVAETTDFSLGGMWAQMGLFAKLVLVALVLMFLGALATIFERLRTYTRAHRQSVAYILALRGFLKDRKLSEAVAQADRHPESPLAKVVGAGLREYIDGMEALREEGPQDVGDFDLVDAVHRQMERCKERETANLKRGLTWLATVGSTAPFVGLLGTVVGVINAFVGIASTGSGGIGAVSAGIAEALVETALGLFVAIPAVWFYNYLSGRLEYFNVEMDNSSSEMVDYFIKKTA